jgi:hypothetical protein
VSNTLAYFATALVMMIMLKLYLHCSQKLGYATNFSVSNTLAYFATALVMMKILKLYLHCSQKLGYSTKLSLGKHSSLFCYK